MPAAKKTTAKAPAVKTAETTVTAKADKTADKPGFRLTTEPEVWRFDKGHPNRGK